MPSHTDPYDSKIPIVRMYGHKVIHCECCNRPLYCINTITNLYKSYDLYICDDCNIGYKAEIFTALNTDYYLSIDPTSIKDIETVIKVKSSLKNPKRKPLCINH